ncbi:MAG TPA: YraN family protein [Dictyoglomaceae bacterium]|nr:YraN family protein [Dictyoglomaceae bacterium]HOL39170.1 YraN family protein [Dictyoglomaceae bacterium]HOP94220.1 YraN family protein [Dictyoglomaceae bacterium]HPP15324.1 YraN family protein [Dictyoglomaceae bacterium]HPU44582.1 YraN family protein [Dictyoglomaceae bacterium]
MNKKEIGDIGEKFAVEFFERRGFNILHKNLRFKFGELDLVVEKSGILVFVEVKTRSNNNFGEPIEAVDYKKQEKIKKMAEMFLANYKKIVKGVRFDVLSVIVLPEGKISSWEYIPNAF